MTTRSLHWPEYLIEAAALGVFMISACVFGTLIWHPSSPVYGLLDAPLAQRAVMGVAMALTLLAIVYSPPGKRSGAHMNPAFTLAFLRLGRVAPRDAVFYTVAQFVGACAGVLAAYWLLGMALADPAVSFVVTKPGSSGVTVAFVAEAAIAFGLMTVVLRTLGAPRLERYTGLAAAVLVAVYITVEAPLSGMSMNPARTFGSAFVAGDWTAVWVYFSAPVVGMLVAAQLHVTRRGRAAVPCAKMRHATPCIFCEYWRASVASGPFTAESEQLAESFLVQGAPHREQGAVEGAAH